MKLFMIALFLVSLALVESKLLGRLLYEKGYFIAENYDARSLDYRYGNGSYGNSYDDQRFHFRSNVRGTYGEMYLRADLRNLSFAIDYYPRASNFDWKENLCEKNSDEQYRSLIHHCGSNTTMRSLTDEERKQLQDYKNEQKGKRRFKLTQSPLTETKRPFEVIYKENRRLIKSVNASEVQLLNGNGMSKNEAFSVTVRIGPFDKENRFQIFGNLANRTFIVEGLPVDSKEECGKTGLEDLHTECEGKIKLRPL